MTQNLAVMRFFKEIKYLGYVLVCVDVKSVRTYYVNTISCWYAFSRQGRVMSRLAVVCGGSRGIGKAVSHLLAQRGCRLAVVSRTKDAARTAVASLHGGECRNKFSLLVEKLLGLLVP